MYEFFLPDEKPLFALIEQTLDGIDTLQKAHVIQTGWTNVTIDATGKKQAYIFRFPRNLFFAKTMVKDSVFCQFIQGKVAVKTPKMCLFMHGKKPFSMHTKIPGRPLSAVHDLTEKQKKNLGEEIAYFLVQLHALNVEDFPHDIKMSSNMFLKDLASVHQGNYDFRRHNILDELEMTLRPVIVHGDFNSGNVLIDEVGHIAGVIDFAFAALSTPYTDLGRFYGRTDTKLGDFLLGAYEEQTSKKWDKKKLEAMINLWHYVDAKYIAYMLGNHPEISLTQGMVQMARSVSDIINKE